MNPPENDDIHTLLRLKKHEQPPPAYFDNFLAEFQRRQRTEMLRRSVWQLAWDRVQAFFETDHAGALRYAMATAMAVVLTAIMAVKIVSPQQGSAPIAQSASPAKHLVAAQSSQNHALTLGNQPPQLGPTAQFFPVRQESRSATPYYVIDARPVSYEAPSGL